MFVCINLRSLNKIIRKYLLFENKSKSIFKKSLSKCLLNETKKFRNNNYTIMKTWCDAIMIAHKDLWVLYLKNEYEPGVC